MSQLAKLAAIGAIVTSQRTVFEQILEYTKNDCKGTLSKSAQDIQNVLIPLLDNFQESL